MNIEHEARFTEAELFSMFNVECNSAWASPNSLTMPLLKVKVKKVKQSKRMKHTCDKIKAGITLENPGKARVADLVAYYNNPLNAGVSPFEV
jgi:hypothetical protein